MTLLLFVSAPNIPQDSETKQNEMPPHEMEGEWLPEIRARLHQLFQQHGRTSLFYRPMSPPVAAFDWDNTCILNDVGEAFFFDAVATLRYRFDLDAFWELIPENLGRKELRTLWCSLARRPFEEACRLPAYSDFRARLASLYYRTIETMGPRAAYAWTVKLLVGLTPQTVVQHVEALIERELNTPLGWDMWRASDGEEVRIARGIRVFSPVVRLIREAQAAGFRAVVVTASPRVVVAPFARRLGISEVYGMTNDLDGDVFAARLIPPETYREGKVLALERYVGRLPLLAVGDAETDAEMLKAATTLNGIAILLDKGDAELSEKGRASGWLIQPRWS